MQEEMNKAMAQLNESGRRRRADARRGRRRRSRPATPRPRPTAELNETSVESRVLEVEQATANVEAQGRLSELRAELGLGDAAAPAATAKPPHRAAGEQPPA